MNGLARTLSLAEGGTGGVTQSSARSGLGFQIAAYRTLLTYTSIAALGTQTKTFTISTTGLFDVDIPLPQFVDQLPSGIIFCQIWLSSLTQVSVSLSNITTSPIVLGELDFNCIIISRNV